MDQVLFATYGHDIAIYRQRAEQFQCGLELHLFSEPAVLSDGLAETISSYQKQLRGFQGRLGIHGAFYDMISASLDPEIVAVTRKRFRQNLHIAAELQAEYVVFHANYMGGFKLANYRPGWHERQVAFWNTLLAEAAPLGVTVLLENMWASDPTIICDVLAAVDQPCFRACLDVAHAALYSDRPVEEWITVLGPYLHACHLNNHDGQTDLHWPLNKGIIDYPAVLALLRNRPQAPLLTLELPDWESIEESLALLELPHNEAN